MKKKIGLVMMLIEVCSVLLITGGISFGSGTIYEMNFEKSTGDWAPAGLETTLTHDDKEKHGCDYSARIVDLGPQGGQANTSFIEVETGQKYLVEVWVKIDPALSDKVRVDVTLWDQNREYRGALDIGEVTKNGEWLKVSNILTIQPKTNASYMVLRVLPATSSPEAKGACWFDDVKAQKIIETTEVRIQEVVQIDPAGEGTRPSQYTPEWFKYPATIDFEDMSGWKMELRGKVDATCYRSQREPLQGNYTTRLSYKSGKVDDYVDLIPPAPVSLPEKWDEAEIWLYGFFASTSATRTHADNPAVTIYIEDAQGRETAVSIEQINWFYWAPIWSKPTIPVAHPSKLKKIRISNLVSGTEERTIYLDNLCFKTRKEGPINIDTSYMDTFPAPIRPESLRPNPRHLVAARLSEEGGGYRFDIDDPVGKLTYFYAPLTGTFGDITCSVKGSKPFRIAKGGGFKFKLGGESINVGMAKATLLGRETRGNKVSVSWRYEARKDSVEITMEVYCDGRSLILEPHSEKGKVESILQGRPEGWDFEPLYVPYLQFYPGYGSGGEEKYIVMSTKDGLFLSRLWDYYYGNFTRLEGTIANYLPLTDGRLHPLRERILYTVSGEFQEVLPYIPNPPAEYGHVLGKYQYWFVYIQDEALSTGDRELFKQEIDKLLKKMRILHRLGIKYMFAEHHTPFFFNRSLFLDGALDEPWAQNAKISRIWKSEEDCLEYIQKVREIGYIVAALDCFYVLDPLGGDWNRDIATDIRLPYAPGRLYMPSLLAMPPIATKYANLKRKLGLGGAYLDLDSMVPPQGWMDDDARRPGAGMTRTLYRVMCQVSLNSKRGYQGPVVGEGGSHWLNAGFCDGNYAQVFPPPDIAKPDIPYLVDFDLLYMHPLQVDQAMGYYSGGFQKNFLDEGIDENLCASLAFGHSPNNVLYPETEGGTFKNIDNPKDFGMYKNNMLRTYFVGQPVNAAYAMVPVSKILYWNGEELQETTPAILDSSYKRRQVRVEYQNGTKVWANGYAEESWKVIEDNKEYILPPFGYLVTSKDGLLAYLAEINSDRVEYVNCKDFVYVYPRTNPVEVAGIWTDCMVIVNKEGAGKIDVVPTIQTGSCRIRPDKFGISGNISVLYRDLDYKTLRTETFPEGTDWVPVKMNSEMEFSALIESL